MLTNAAISAAKPREKPFKLSDGGGLYLLVNPTGKRWWRLKFRVHGKEKLLSLGVFPEATARKMFAVECKPSDRAKPVEPLFERVSNYVEARYGFSPEARLPVLKKLPYLAGMIYYANLRKALLDEYDI